MSKRIRWTKPRQAKLVEWMEQGIVLDTLEVVVINKTTIDAICSAGNRFFGFGRHVLKDGTTILKSSVAWHKTKQSKSLKVPDDEILAEEITEPYNATTVIIGEARPTALTVDKADILEAVKVLKDKSLSDIISAFIAVSKDQQE
jgi:hypothetical protein